MTNPIDPILTFETLKGARHIDYMALCEKAEEDLRTLRRLLEKNKDDKNVQAVVKQVEQEVRKMREQANEWLTMVELQPYMRNRIVILLSQDEEDEE